MIDLNLSDLLGGEPMPDTMPVFHIHTALEGPRKVLEKIAAEDRVAAEAEAKKLLGDVDGLFVTGPHETVEVKTEASSDKTAEASEFAEVVKAESREGRLAKDGR